jgi:hypothetical protein
MFSESFANGTVRMVREATRKIGRRPPAIYGHNAGIGVRTRCIFREVIDLLARLDGIDFRQTAPVRPGTPFLKPYGLEWIASEERACRDRFPGIKPTTVVRAGALDQGNIGLNLADAAARGISDGVSVPQWFRHQFDQECRGQTRSTPGCRSHAAGHRDPSDRGELKACPDRRSRRGLGRAGGARPA